ncbi:Oxidoreductase [Kalmusia sp. IMI 367209]|nr:Oxidoreductase [Kalmusia sp. IMI 367209]
MFRPATRLIAGSTAVRTSARAAAPARRFISTAPPTQKSRSWKSLAARVGIAGAIIYYYNTTEVFAEEPRHAVQALPIAHEETEQLPTIEDVSKARQQRKAEQEAIAAQLAAQKQAAAESAPETAAVPAGGVEELEEEAGQQGAFNPETGEINWDCPCLGGMADGPCGPEFKAAFSCFVYSTEEPKGMDCIEKFKDMQGCFRQYPEIYGSELDSDADDEDDIPADAAPATTAAETSALAETQGAKSQAQSASDPLKAPLSKEQDSGMVPDSYRPSSETEREPVSESEQLVPKAAHDASNATAEKK